MLYEMEAHELVCKLCMDTFCQLKVTNMMAMQNFEVPPGNWEVLEVCTSGNYALRSPNCASY